MIANTKSAKSALLALALSLVACGGAKKTPASSADSVPAMADDDAGPSAATFSELGDAGAPPAPPPAEGTDTAKPAAPAAAKGDEEGARAMLGHFVAPGADHAALTRALRPTTEDYKAMFDDKTAAKVEAAQAKDWNSNKATIKPKATQTEVKVWSATGADLAAGKGAATEFPGDYKKMGKHLAPGVLFFRFKFVEPGKDVGTAYDGLAFVNGHWAIAPKPWRAISGKTGGDESAEADAPAPKPKKPKGKKKK